MYPTAVHRVRCVACLSVLLWVGACGRSRPEKKKPLPQAATVAPTEKQSVGWQSSNTPDPPTELEREKLERERAAAAKGIEIPPELAGRTKPKAPAVLDVYVDGKATTSLAASRFDVPLPLAQAVGTQPIRNIFIHAPDHNMWISAAEIGSFSLRRNRRGMIKLEMVDKGNRGKGDGTGRATRKTGEGDAPIPPGGNSHKAVREHEIRNVEWIEVRTQSSAPLDHEPS